MRKYFFIGLVITSFLSSLITYCIFKGYRLNAVSTLNSREIYEPQTIEKILKDKQKAMEDEKNKLLIGRKFNKMEKEKVQTIRAHKESAIAVLVFACNRVSIARCLDQLLRYRPSAQQFPIIVSHGCPHAPTANVIRAYGDRIFRMRLHNQTGNRIPPKEQPFKGYYEIAKHYGWALNRTFFHFNFSTVIIIEDDLDVSTDLFEYFLGTLPIMRSDPTLWCVSAWNDNGRPSLIRRDAPHLLHRTDFFPGLGWMLTKNIWVELAPKWPPVYWDDWIREPEQRKGRACIRPEISRTKTFGDIGVSNGQFYEKYLQYVHLNNIFVNFTKLNLVYLLKDNYDVRFNKTVYESKIVPYMELKSNNKIIKNGPVRILYNTRYTFAKIAETFGLMNDLRSGIPRTGYMGVVSFYYNNRWVYLAPHDDWKTYNPDYSNHILIT